MSIYVKTHRARALGADFFNFLGTTKKVHMGEFFNMVDVKKNKCTYFAASTVGT